MENLYFRRQFILGDKRVTEMENWKNLSLKNNYYLSWHPDLNCNISVKQSSTLVLLGFILDPYEPMLSNSEILDRIHDNVSFSEMLSSTYHYSGRWILLFQNDSEMYIFNDPIGQREVYYFFKNDMTICATDPSLIKKMYTLDLVEDKLYWEYIQSKYFIKKEHPIFGNKTSYKNVFHLMPNEYLNLYDASTTKFWLNFEKNTSLNKNQYEIIEEVARILSNTILSCANRTKVAIPVTAGVDSRVLLAASKEVKHSIFYYVYQQDYSEDYMDIKVPKDMFSDLDLNFHIINTDKKLDDYKKKILFNNISLAREHPRQNAIEAYFSTMSDYVVLNGVGGELVRNYYGIDHPSDNLIDGEYIASEIIACPKKLAYVRIELDLWLKNNRAFAEEHKISIPNLFYWEQRMGNWGTLNRNEEDMVVESFFPWVNRKLLMLLAELPDSIRTKDNNDAFLQIISILWPELLKYPINPIKGKEKVVAFVRKVLPKKIENSIRRFLFS